MVSTDNLGDYFINRRSGEPPGATPGFKGSQSFDERKRAAFELRASATRLMATLEKQLEEFKRSAESNGIPWIAEYEAALREIREAIRSIGSD